MTGSFIYDAVRTPFGRYGKAYADTRPDDLAAVTLRALVERSSALDPAQVDDVLLGAANQSGEDNRNVARMALLLAELPTSIPGSTVNRLCGSSLESVIQASRAIEVGDASVVIAGGVESMTRAPYAVPKPSTGFPSGDATMVSTTLGWRFINPDMPVAWTLSNGESAELLAERYSIDRGEQDVFAARSHQLAAAAWDAGTFENEIVPVPGSHLNRDESIRPGSSVHTLAPLQPVFKPGGTVTAGNSSPLSDGASAVLVGSENALDAEPLARIAGRGVSGITPELFGIAPVEAANRALARAGRTWAEIDVVELNEAFASQSLACMKLWPELDPAKVNIHGGAIALGHPLGASGGRIVGHLAHELARRGGGVGVAALCIGVGQGLAVVLER